MSENKKKIIILGGGLAGLSASYHSGFSVYEAGAAPGGTAGSIAEQGFVFDYGIHVLHSNDPWFNDLMKTLNVDFRKHFRKGKIFSQGSYAAYPFQVNTSHLPLGMRCKCVLGYLVGICRPASSPPDNYEEWLRNNFGHGFAEYFLIPYSKKFWGIPPADMTYEWAGQQRVPRPSLMEVIKGAFKDQKGSLGPNSQFLYPSAMGSGFAAIALTIADACKCIHYNMTATAIDPERKRIYFNDQMPPIPYDRLITTIPLPDMIKLLPCPPRAIQDAVDRLRFNSIAVINLGIKRKDISKSHWIHFPDEDISFFRISFPGNFCKGLNPKGSSTIQAEISFNHLATSELNKLPERVRRDLISVGVLQPEDKIIYQNTQFIKYGYVVYDINRENAVKTIHDYLRALDIFPCGRYGCWEYQWVDEAVRSGKDTVNKIMNSLTSQ